MSFIEPVEMNDVRYTDNDFPLLNFSYCQTLEYSLEGIPCQ